MTLKTNANSGPLTARGFNKKYVKEMVQTYRKKEGSNNSLRYAHFNAYELLELFMANGVLSKDLSRAIQAEKESITPFGLKIYLGTHCAPLTPPYPGNIDPSEYLGKTTTILCNTRIKSVDGKNEFWDILDDLHAVGIVGEGINSGQALDQSEIAPPYTVTSPDPDGDQDVNNAP